MKIFICRKYKKWHSKKRLFFKNKQWYDTIYEEKEFNGLLTEDIRKAIQLYFIWNNQDYSENVWIKQQNSHNAAPRYPLTPYGIINTYAKTYAAQEKANYRMETNARQTEIAIDKRIEEAVISQVMDFYKYTLPDFNKLLNAQYQKWQDELNNN